MKMFSVIFVIMAFLLLASSVMAEDVSSAPDIPKKISKWHFLPALKYSEPTGLYANPKIMIGDLSGSADGLTGGLGIILDAGIGLSGYKTGIGFGLLLMGDIGNFDLPVFGTGIEAVYQKKYDWENNGEIGGEFSYMFMMIDLFVGGYQPIDGDGSFKWRVGGGIGF